MDALPIQDIVDAPYHSMNLGVKHACGHDVHMTIALGAAKIISSLRSELHGTCSFIFQPAEEALDGAQAMIASGALDSPVPDAIIALHAFPLPVGKIGLTTGRCLAGAEEYRVKFDAPADRIPVLIQKILPPLNALSQHTPPASPQSFDALIQRMMSGGDLNNSMYLNCWRDSSGSTEGAHIACLVSLTDYTERHKVQRTIRKILDTVVSDTGVTYTFWTSFAIPPTINDGNLIARLRPFVEEAAGRENVVFFNAPYPFAHEDFALYAHYAPTALLWLGTANHVRGIDSILHTADYDVDENALVFGTAVVTYLLLKLSQKQSLL
jgi:amidohydrolase